MFALFEAGIQVIRLHPTPRFGYASRGANHVAPLRGAYVVVYTINTRHPSPNTYLASRTYLTLIHLRSVGHGTRCTMFRLATSTRM